MMTESDQAVPWYRRVGAVLLFYPTLLWNMALGRWLKLRPWYSRIDRDLIVGAYPFARDVPAMQREGVAAVVNTCYEYAGPLDAYAKAGIEQFHMPTVDFTHPRLEDIQAAVEFIQRFAAESKTTYVHCKAGRARSATVALCWLVKYRGLTASQAQALLLDRRPHVNPRIDQRPVVGRFIAQMQSVKRS